MRKKQIATNKNNQAYMRNSDGKLIRVETSVPFKILEITENGTYNSLDYGHFGWSQVKTKIPIKKAKIIAPLSINALYKATDQYNTIYYEPGVYFDSFSVEESLHNSNTILWELDTNKYGYIKKAASSISASEHIDSITATINPYICYNKKSLREFIFNPNVLNVGEYAFYKANLRRVYLPNAVYIDKYAFYSNENSEDLILSNNIRAIEDHSFEGCPFTKTYTIRLKGFPGIKNCKIGSSAFYNSLKSATNLYIKDINNLGVYSFANSCAANAECRIENVENIESLAFYNSGIRYMIFIGYSVPQLSSRLAIDEGTFSKKYYVPYNSYYNYRTATNWTSVSNLFGWGSFSMGQNLPQTTEDGRYNLEWYTTKDFTSSIITKATKDGEFYCKVTGV